MRQILSDMLVKQAKNDESFIVLSGDHGYALFDSLKKKHPERFVNAGIMEQSMVGMATGLVNVGYKPVIYGLAAFIPMRVLEQIKLDVCFSKVPVKFIGDGAGVVYSYLGNSHFCLEDLGALMPLPEIEIYSPGDSNEMSVCLEEYFDSDKPSYLRIGKSDNPEAGVIPKNTKPYFTSEASTSTCIVSMGSMNGISAKLAKEFNISHLSIMKLKPISIDIVNQLKSFGQLIVIEEHQKYGGLKSILMNEFSEQDTVFPKCKHICFEDKFVKNCGSYQYVLSEQGMSFEQLSNTIDELLK
jgi:transketolase